MKPKNNIPFIIGLALVASVLVMNGYQYTTESQSDELWHSAKGAVASERYVPSVSTAISNAETYEDIVVKQKENKEKEEKNPSGDIDYIEIAKYLCQQSVDDAGHPCKSKAPSNQSEFNAYVHTSGHTAGYSYSGSSHAGWTRVIDLYSMRTVTSRFDCASFVSMFEYCIGNNPTCTIMSSSTWYDMAGSPHWQEVKSASGGLPTFADTKAGDVICRNGHAAVIIDQDDTNTYTADAGSCSSIKKTAENGRCKTYANTDSVQTFKEGKSIRVLRYVP